MTAKKRTTVKKKVSFKKRTVSKKKVAKKKARAKVGARLGALFPGYKKTETGVFVPTNIEKPVPANKLRAGFKNAKKEIESIIDEVVGTMTQNYVISEIEFAASFSADGKFMGFGVGGAATMKIKIRPEG